MNRRHFIRSFIPDPSGDRRGSTTFSATPSLAAYGGPWNRTTAAHLLRRTVLAPTVEELHTAEQMTMDDLVQRLLTPAADLPDPPPYVKEWMSRPAMFFNPDRIDLIRTFLEELRRWWIGLMVHNELNVQERMTLFWHNHFATQSVEDIRYMYMQNQLFRQYALGNFKELVRAVTADKAMLFFLNGKQNKQGAVNENYARELQELFTIGAADNNGAANYTQADVVNAAHILTGYDWYGAGISGSVECSVLTGHDPVDKLFYGGRIAGELQGVIELDRMLDVIFSNRETACHIVRKLYRFFVYSDAPSTPATPIPEAIESNIIAPLADEFRSSDWSIVTVLRRLFSSEHFYDPEIMGSNIRSPIDLLVGSVRAMGVASIPQDRLPFTIQEIHLNASVLGQSLFDPPGVQGWGFYRSWISTTTLPQRHDYTDKLLGGIDSFYLEVQGDIENEPVLIHGDAGVDLLLAYAGGFSSFVSDPEGLIAEICEHLLAYPASPRLVGHLLDALLQGQPGYEWSSASDSIKESRLREMMKLLLRSANYQLM